MSTSVNRLQERTQDANDLLCDIIPSAITLATMLRHRKMAIWLREEFCGYAAGSERVPPYRRDQPGQIVANTPEDGWAPVPLEEWQIAELGHLELPEGARSLEQIYLNCRKGGGHREPLTKDAMAAAQKQINLSVEQAINLGHFSDGWRPEFAGAELAIHRSREVYGRLLRTIRAAIHLWSDTLIQAGMVGEHNHYTPEERKSVEHLDTPDVFWREAMERLDELPVPDVRELGFLERILGRSG